MPDLMHKLLLCAGTNFENHAQFILISFPGTVLGTAVERLIKFVVLISRRTFVN